MSLKPICIPCQRFYRPEKNGQIVLEGAPILSARPGTIDSHLWAPYKLWRADRWRCEGCGHEIVCGSALAPFSERHHPTFSLELNRFSDQLVRVNDC